MTTSQVAFNRLVALPPEIQRQIECRYDGTIPDDFVVPVQPECFSVAALREEMRGAEIYARQYWRMAKDQLRNAARRKSFDGAAPSREYVRRCRKIAWEYLERRADMKRLAAACADKLAKMES